MEKEEILRIAEEVKRQVSEGEPAKGAARDCALVIVSNPVAGAEKAVEALRRKTGRGLRFAAVGVPGKEYAGAGEVLRDPDVQTLFDQAAGSGEIVLLAPRISLLENIVCGRDEGKVENVAVRSLLWGKKVRILMDFTPPKFKRDALHKKIEGIIDDLTDMGAEVGAYQWMETEGTEGLSLVTENEVLEAYTNKSGRVACAKGAIVTPAARDRAKELNIRIDR